MSAIIVIKYRARGGLSMMVSKAQQRAVTKYVKENYDEFKVRLPKGTKDQIRTAADQQGQSVNAWISQAITEKMKKESAGA